MYGHRPLHSGETLHIGDIVLFVPSLSQVQPRGVAPIYIIARLHTLHADISSAIDHTGHLHYVYTHRLKLSECPHTLEQSDTAPSRTQLVAGLHQKEIL
jgi:hypothetical protein